MPRPQPSKVRKRTKASYAARKRWKSMKDSQPADSSNVDSPELVESSEVTAPCKRRYEQNDNSKDLGHSSPTLVKNSDAKPLGKKRCEGNDNSADLGTSDNDNLPNLIIETDPADLEVLGDIAPGRRIVDITHLSQQLEKLQQHVQKCTYGKMKLLKEDRNGMQSMLVYECVACGIRLPVTTNPDEQAVNDAAVWGAMAVGIGRTQLEKLMGALEVPIMSPKKFRKHKLRIEKMM